MLLFSFDPSNNSHHSSQVVSPEQSEVNGFPSSLTEHTEANQQQHQYSNAPKQPQLLQQPPQQQLHQYQLPSQQLAHSLQPQQQQQQQQQQQYQYQPPPQQQYQQHVMAAPPNFAPSGHVPVAPAPANYSAPAPLAPAPTTNGTVQAQNLVVHDHSAPKRQRVDNQQHSGGPVPAAGPVPGGSMIMPVPSSSNAAAASMPVPNNNNPQQQQQEVMADSDPAATAAAGGGRGRKKSQAQIDRRRERNRILARRTRLRKKFFFESLQKEVMDLQRQNSALKELVRSKLEPGESRQVLDSCTAAEKLPESVVEACSEHAAEMDQQDFNLVRSVQQSQHSFIITDPCLQDNPIVFASDGFLKITGYARESVLGRNCRFLQGPETSKDKLASIRNALQTSEDVTVTLVNYMADGTPFWNKLFIAALRDSSNNIVNFIGVVVKVASPPEDDPEHGKELDPNAKLNMNGKSAAAPGAPPQQIPPPQMP